MSSPYISSWVSGNDVDPAVNIWIWNHAPGPKSFDAIYDLDLFGIEVGVEPVVEVDGVPCEFVLFQNYPNPFNPIIEIHYSLTEESYVKLKIYNILGQKVTTLIEHFGVYKEFRNVGGCLKGVGPLQG